MDPLELRAEIAALRHTLYFNWGGSGPSPRRVLEAAAMSMDSLNDRFGPMSPPALEEAASTLHRCRARLAALLGVSREEIALMESTSDGINRVAWGLPWRPGDEVVITDFEHISGIAPWEHLARRFGIRVVRVPIAGREGDPAPLRAVLTPRTRLIFVSHVSYKSGALLPLDEWVALAKQRGILIGADGAQAVGQLPVDLRTLGVDFYALPGQKWLLGPDGTGALYVRKEVQEMLEPSLVGWATLSPESWSGETPLRFHADARRYEVAGRFVPAFAALAEAVDVIQRVGVAQIRARIQVLADRLAERLARIPGVRLYPSGAERPQTGLVACTVDPVDPAELTQSLWRERRIVCRYIDEPRLLRFSVHAFNTEDEVDEAADVLRHALAAAGS